MPEALNNRGNIGDNTQVDHAEIVTSRLAQDYAEAIRNVDQLLDDARDMPGVINSDAEALMLGGMIKKLKDIDARMEAYREAEKQPYLRGGNAVDTFFHAQRDKLGRRKGAARTARPGAIDVLQGVIDVWQEDKRRAEMARLEAERLEAARLAREEAARLRKLQEEADEAARAAMRARSEQTKRERSLAAEEAAVREADAKAAADLAREKAEEARLATMVKPAELVRVRGNDASGAGVLLTTAREGYSLVTDRSQLNMDWLRPYFTDFELDKALRAWAKATGHKVPMPGAEIGFRNKGVTR